MTLATFPINGAFPLYLELEINVPDSWAVAHSEGALLCVAAPYEPEVFRANVLVTLASYEGSVDLNTAAQQFANLIAEQDQFSLIEQSQVEVIGLLGYRIEFTADKAGVGSAYQALSLTVYEKDGRTYVVQVAGVCRAVDADSLVPVIRESISSVRGIS